MSEIVTHLGIDRALCGEPVELSPGCAVVHLQTSSRMGADSHGLVHGGFIFGQADYAAMLAVNDPNVVLGAADTRFTAPVRVGDLVVARASCTTSKGRRHTVEVECRVGDALVMQGTFTTFVLDRHVLD